MGLIGRVASLVAQSGLTLTDSAVAGEARRILAFESPRAGDTLVDQVVASVVGFGPLDPLLRDGSVTDVLVNGPDEIWVDRGEDLALTDVRFESTEHLLATVERAIAGLGLRVDRSSPTVDGRLRDGSRIHVAIPPATVDYPVVAIRRFSPAIRTFDQLLDGGGVTTAEMRFLQQATKAKQTIIVSGGTGAGKTTLLNLLASEISPTERLVTIEDSAELDFPGHVVRLEARGANAEGQGEVSIRQLLRSALRLRPDRIILGEVRGAEALDLITALNTGHQGSMSTVHANSPEEAMWRLETLALLDGGSAPEAIKRQLQTAVDIVVQIARESGKRKIVAICTVSNNGTLEEVDG